MSPHRAAVRRAGRLTVALGALLALAPVAAAAAPTVAPPTAPAPAPAFPLEGLAPGMEGYGLTEMPGGAVERFEVRVLALQHDLGPGFPLVLVRVAGDAIEATGGVAAGMSGSPVYLPWDGEPALLGGIGYVFPDADPFLALVTPIGVMREQTGGARADGVRPGGARADGIALGEAVHGQHVPRGAVPVATPVLIGGLGPRSLGMLQRTVLDRSPFGPVAVQAAGAGTADLGDGPLLPGGAAAAQLVRGDLTISVVGTVTEVDGAAVLAFAHPFLGGGPASWPLTAAEVTAVVPSRVVPFKLANVGRSVLGTIVEDRPAGVRATLGTEPDLIPVTLTVTAGATQRTLELEVTADERLWPVLVAVATLEAIDRTWQRVGPGTADVAWELDLPGGSPLRMSEATVASDDLGVAAAHLTLAPLAILADNAFAPSRPDALRIAVTLDERRRDAEVVELVLEEPVPAAGGVLGVVVRLQPWRRSSEVRTLTLRLPPDLSGELELRARGGAEPRPDDETFEDDLLRSYGELLTALRERAQGGDLVFEVRAPGAPWRELERLSLRDVVVGSRTETLTVVGVAPDAAGDEGAADPGATDATSDPEPADDDAGGSAP